MRNKQVNVNLATDEFERVKRWADENMRTVSGQIRYVLMQELRRIGRVPVERPEDQPE